MRKRKSTELRQEEIVRAALALVEQQGLDKLSIQAIAERVGLVPAAIYRHFKRKEDIVAALIDFTEQSLQRNLDQVLPLEETAVAKLEQLFLLHVDLLRQEAAIPRLLFFLLSSERTPELKVRILSVVGGYQHQVRKILLQGQKCGQISPEIDATAAATLFLGMLQPLAILGQLQPQILAEYPPQLWRTYQRSIAP